MNEIDKTNLTDQTKFRLNEITKFENYFNQEINQRKICSKKLSKYVAAFDYIGNVWIVLSAGLYLFICECCWSSNWNSRSKFYFNFFSNYRNNQEITKNNKKQKEKAWKDSNVG